jgi:U6 snRNA-associated Sm-like protein LSm1
MLPPRPFVAMLPDYLPGAASLFEQLDKQIMVVLRDGRNLVGVLRSFDQYSNMVLEDTYERHVVDDKYGDLPLGLYLVRGDSMVMLGEVDPKRESENLTKVTADEIIELLQESVEAGAKLEWDFE